MWKRFLYRKIVGLILDYLSETTEPSVPNFKIWLRARWGIK